MCHGQGCRVLLGHGHPTFNGPRSPYNGYINPYYWVDDHTLLYVNNGSLDPGTFGDYNLENIGIRTPFFLATGNGCFEG